MTIQGKVAQAITKDKFVQGYFNPDKVTKVNIN